MSRRREGRRFRCGRWALALALLCAAAPPAPGEEEWKFDVLHRKRGGPLRGLLLERTPKEVRFKSVVRRPGEATRFFTYRFDPAEVERLDLLGPEDRAKLTDRLDALARQEEVLSARLRSPDSAVHEDPPGVEKLDLRPSAWGKDGKGKALAYRSEHFRLVSNARAEVVQLAAVHLEAVYAGFARSLPPRAAGRPTTVLLARSLADYHALLKEQGRDPLLNAAFFDPARNEIVCASDLQRLGEELARVAREHAKKKGELTEKEKELARLYKGKVLLELCKPIEEARRKIAAQEKANERAFVETQQRLFRRLYHEAFHAYLANFVYPEAEAEVPRWLNEGLAQVFETAVLEAGELRLGRADRERVTRAQKAGELVPLADLLRSGPKQFVVAHSDERQTSDRYYVTAWALACYLTFDRGLVGTDALDEYVRALRRGTAPTEAFRDLVGRPLAAFEKEFREYVRQMRPDESLAKGPGK